MTSVCFYLFLIILTGLDASAPLAENNSSEVIVKRESEISCGEGWFLFDGMCYILGSTVYLSRWLQASKNCKEKFGGGLVSIHSQELSDFLRAFILMDIQETAWIGLSDRNNESTFEWEDGTAFDYENWEPGEPSGSSNDKEDCVEFIFYSEKTKGMSGWNDLDCDSYTEYICQKKAEKQDKKYIDPRFCSDGGWKYKTSCYHVVERKLTWQRAEDYCSGVFQGHLVTINDISVNIFLEYILRNYTDDMWIGLKIKNGFEQQWSSEWSVVFTNWLDEPRDGEYGMCGVWTSDKWTIKSCKRELPFVCETSTKTVPYLASPEDMTCPNEPTDWRDFGGKYCYRIISEYLGWSEAENRCQRLGGTLATFHSQSELDIVQHFLLAKFLQAKYYFWIGLHRSELNESFRWTDGTPLDFEAWSDKRPNNEDKHCVQLNPNNMKWYDRSCDQIKHSLCSIQKISSNPTTNSEAPTATFPLTSAVTLSGEKNSVNVISKGGTRTVCDKGWFPFDDICYRAWGVIEMRRQWNDASKYCKDLGGNLASIHSQEISDFLTAFVLMNTQETLWIGLNDIKNESVYEWDDGTPFDFENWEPDEPSGPTRTQEDCVEMVFVSGKPTGLNGHWNDLPCTVKRNFICQKKGKTQAGNSEDARFCPDGGWKLRTSCYHVVETKLTWQEAEDYCIREFGGHLVTINDFAVKLFLDYVLRSFTDDVWIGLKTRKEFQQQWSSGWYVSFTDWMDEPRDCQIGMCAVRTSDKWMLMFCKRRQSFICEISNKTMPYLTSPEDMSCPNEPADWRDLGGKYCYHFITEHLTWFEANSVCLRRGGTLSSFHSQTELEVLQPFLIANFYKSPFYSWIGLFRQSQLNESFQWADGTPLDFYAWPDNKPDIKDKLCVELSPFTLKWYEQFCYRANPSICSIQKILSNKTTNDAPITTSCSNGISTYIFIGVVCCCLFVIALLAIAVCYFHARVNKLERGRIKPIHFHLNKKRTGKNSDYGFPDEDEDYDTYEIIR